MMVSEDILLSRGAVYKKIKKGDFIFTEGSKCNYYYQLVEGKISWVNYDSDGKVFIQSIVQPGECFGELPLFDDEPYAANSVAESDSVIVLLPKITFQQLIKDNFELHMSFSRMLTQRIRYKFFVLKELACHNPEQLIISLLNFHKEKYQEEPTELFKINFTRQQLAGMTGLRVETVIRVIRKLSEKGMLKIDKGKVYLLNGDSNHKFLV